MRTYFLLIAVISFVARAASAQEAPQGPVAPALESPPPAASKVDGVQPEHSAPAASSDDLSHLDLEELLNMKVDIATRSARRLNEAPSIVSVITREEIESYGARDAIDILRAVPGFEFGIDVGALEGLMFRGNWVHEGKAQVMINGLPLNDYGYGNVNYFLSTPASMVERVEIIRGPGSALYGGFAELAVINFVTRRGSDLNGVQATGALTTLDGKDLGYRGEVSFGAKLGEADVSASVGYTKDAMSERLYRDFFGGSLQQNMDNAYGQWDHIVAQGSLKGFRVNYRRTSMSHLGQDSFAQIVPKVTGFNSELINNYWEGGSIAYAFSPVEHLTLTPELSVSRGNSVESSVYAGGSFGGQYTSASDLERYKGELIGSYDFEMGGELTLGLGYVRDTVVNVGVGITADKTIPYPVTTAPGVQPTNDPNSLSYTKYTESKYALGQYIVQIGDTGLGARFA